jgi:hypothetical protein
MKMPSIDKVRGWVSILASLVLLGAFVFQLVRGGDEDLLVRLLTLIISLTSGVNGAGLLARSSNSNGDHT